MFYPLVFVFPPVPPLAPSDLSVSDVTDSSVTLKWAAATSADSSPIENYVIDTQDINGKVLHTAQVSNTEQTYCANNLAEKTSYLFSVKAQNVAGFSETVTLSSPVTTKAKIGV